MSGHVLQLKEEDAICDCIVYVNSMWMPHVPAKMIPHKPAQKFCFRTSCAVFPFTLIHLGGCRF